MKNKTTFKILHSHSIDLNLKAIAFFIFLIVSCSNKKEDFFLNAEKQSEVENILSTSDFTCRKDDLTYKLIVNSSKLNTLLGREYGASIASLLFYESVADEKALLEYNTLFEIIYLDRKLTYTYSLQDLSDVLKGQEIIDDTVMKLKHNNLSNNSLFTKELNNSNIDWSQIEDISFGGFQIEKTIDDDVILYRVFLNPNQFEIYFSVSKSEKKIIKVDIK